MNVTVYSTPTCGWCKRVKAFLEEHHVDFTEIDVSQDQEKAKEMIEKTGQMGVPVTEINDALVIGFDEPTLRKLLEI